ncbi:MAG: Undecaprenyl-phosphate N-acetylglucosaminyl 1-phosphate transferase [Candidatus Woesebacteria bacterium GW2011_GWC2_31_9]|uniref:Undecaprenyl-phosphate N-acetylglucosaminyl 1-phosphate transferase n=1 Tax=Candidatus Woesebacteria bacterium GW2011_GWC2_31_9 TaxID=1618586 RepID=A0A0G0BLP2_9BACT|nr:MAG: Undecaprenyl-phosphate N-acetylglucosaminyl 1-phosphate transferase [Candidatus Woesebacteria bacterium GW2011_GWC2_31_9]
MAKLISLLFIPLFFSFLISYFITPIVIRFAKKLKIMDDPRGKTHPKIIHDKPTPRGGGIPVFIAILIASLVFIPIDKHLIAILIGAFVIFVMGFLDDRYNLNPYLRLAIGMVAALIPILSGIGISFLTNPFGGILDLSNPLISDLFALIWIVFMMNMLNMGAKGIDGQLSGVTVISAITIAALSFYYSADITQWPVIILTAVTAGAFLGFFPWHKFPQKIMPGYGGATLAGYMLAIASILSTTKVGTLIVVLGIPLIDTGYSIIRRILSGKSPVWGDRGHLHHKLLDSGLSKKQVSQVYWSLTAILGILALNLNTSSKLYTIVGVVFLIGGIIIWLTYRSK